MGPYRLEGRLGSGGMGQVFLGRSRADRAVAVKVVRPELAGDAGFRRRFAREAAAARKVGGFYTAQVVDADPDADPPWMTTAYIPGPSLDEAVQAYGPLPATAISVLGAGLAEGLTAIHGCGLVHRDLKPSNVILAADGPRVIDFGIARALDATHYTASIVGTPAFMSPEQGRDDPIGPHSDVFSLGSVLVFAATGHSPFGTGPAHAIIYRVIHDQPDLTGLPAYLTGLIAACLNKNPTDRPALTAILDQFTTRSEATARWLPPPITTMISERAVQIPSTPKTPRAEQADADSAGPELPVIPPERLPVWKRKKIVLISAAAVLAVAGGSIYGVYAAGSPHRSAGSSSKMPGCTDVKRDGTKWSATCTIEHGNLGAKTICSDGTTLLGPLASPGVWIFGGDCSGHGTITWRGTYWTR
ncbi:MAG: serine/threonine protein kinase [Actinoallomurus sp.]